MLSWVLGAGGLLGRALTRTLEALPGRHYAPAEPLAWDDAARLHAQLGQAAQQFCALAAAQPAGGLACVYWAAGIGTMDGAAAALALETEALAALVQALARCGAGLGAGSLRLCLASSAGALHAGAGAALVTEHTPATPTTPYAHEKLRQEALLHAAAAGAAHLAPRVCRISTLYGSAAAPGRDKGLIQHAASALAQRRPLHVFVPLDTLRDYIAAPDASLRLACAARHPQPPAHSHSLVASGTSSSISHILELLRRLSGRRPLVVSGAHWRGALYNPCVRFAPSAWLEQACAAPPRTLAEGLAEVLRERLGGH